MSDAECKWCRDSDYKGSRCSSGFSEQLQCFQVEDANSYTDLLQNRPINLDSKEDIVLVQPQRVGVKVRPRSQKPHSLPVTIGMSKQYPLDMYFLMDLSYSMNATRTNVADQGGNIISGIKTITEDLRTGFGSFVEKALAPFTSSIAEFNCPAPTNCTPPYSFWHRSSLKAREAEEFKREVNDAPLAGNVDDPEGALDALMQVMTCSVRVGWRPDARKLIFVATDRDFHYAMDGKLVGILEPNDGKCHLDQQGYYTQSDKLDYPSISQISNTAQQGSFVIVFLVLPRYERIYKEMSKLIPGSSVAILAMDAVNIVDLIRKKYEEISSSIRLTSDDIPDGIRLEIKSDCSGKFPQQRTTDTCQNIDLGTTVDFTVDIHATKCIKGKQFTLSPVGIGQRLTVEVETICDCPCENPNANAGYVENSPDCSGKGDDACGICRCNQGFTGSKCECDANNLPDNSEIGSSCRDPKNPDIICNGRGKCECGLCTCLENDRGLVYGQYCECDNFSCLQNPTNNLICSGHGRCACSMCQCHKNWSGDDCSCDSTTLECISPFNGQLCSGNGGCECNRCKCTSMEDSDGLYTGQHCEKEANEWAPCAVLRDCVECQAFSEEDCSTCKFQLEEVNIGSNQSDWLPDIQPCQFENKQGCTYYFSSLIDGVHDLQVFLHVINGSREQCGTGLGIWLSIIIVALVLLISLIAIIIYKVFIEVKGRRQVAMFEKQKQQAAYARNDNVMYKSPITTFKNPMYGKAVN